MMLRNAQIFKAHMAHREQRQDSGKLAESSITFSRHPHSGRR